MPINLTHHLKKKKMGESRSNGTYSFQLSSSVVFNLTKPI